MKQRAIKRVIKRRLAKVARGTFKGRKIPTHLAPNGMVLAAHCWTVEKQYGRAKPCSPYGGFLNLRYYGECNQDHWLHDGASRFPILSARHVPVSQVGLV